MTYYSPFLQSVPVRWILQPCVCLPHQVSADLWQDGDWGYLSDSLVLSISMHMSSRRQDPVYSSPSRPQLYFPVFLLSLAPVGGNRLQWPHCSLSTAAHSQTHSWRLSPPAPTALPFFLSHSFSLSLVVWRWLILSLCPLPHLFSLKQFTCKISTHTVTLPLCAWFSSFRLPGNTELSNCVFIGLSWIRVPGCMAKCK